LGLLERCALATASQWEPALKSPEGRYGYHLEVLAEKLRALGILAPKPTDDQS
jgi:hypothetical protein